MAIAVEGFFGPGSLNRLDRAVAHAGEAGIACGMASWVWRIPAIHVIGYKAITEAINYYLQALFPSDSPRIHEMIQLHLSHIDSEWRVKIEKVVSISIDIFTYILGWGIGTYVMTLIGVQITLIDAALLFFTFPFFQRVVKTMLQ